MQDYIDSRLLAIGAGILLGIALCAVIIGVAALVSKLRQLLAVM